MKEGGVASRRRGRASLVLGLAALYLLHNDSWHWAAPNRLEALWGLPAGFVYHVGFCVAVAVFLGFWVWRFGVVGEAEARETEAVEREP